MRTVCKNCGGDHPVWDCKRPAKKSGSGVGSVLSGTRDTQGHMDTPSKPVTTGKDKASKVGVAPNLPDTSIRKPGRPRTGFDKLAYNRDYMRKYRAKLKAQKEMGK